MIAILLLLAIAILPRSLRAQQRWERQVQARLDRASEAVRPSSRAPISRNTGMLNTEESASLKAPLVEGESYAIVAVCDDDCTRLELTLLTPSGSELAKDRNGASLPILRFTPSRTMTYGVRLVMEGCRWNPCWYGVAVVPQGNRAAPQQPAGQRAPM
jgi:hypothetical protein